MTNEQAYVMDSYKSICLRYDGGLGRRNVGGGGRGGDGLEDLGLGANDKAVGGHQATLRVEQSTAMGASVLELRTTVLVLGSLSDLTIDGLRHAECRRDQRGDDDQGLKKQRGVVKMATYFEQALAQRGILPSFLFYALNDLLRAEII